MRILLISISALILIMGCISTQTISKLKPLSTNATYCDAQTLCVEGYCYQFEDQATPICWTGNPCNRCVSGNCNMLESYPMRVICASETSTANPASTHCIELGYNLTVVNKPEGQVGYCIFNDGSECEEWAFYSGECDESNPAPCKDLCGDGTCQEIVCLGSTCPCSENNITCPTDCA